MSYEMILLDKSEGIGTITLNRPEVLNAMNSTLFREMDEAVSELEEDADIESIIFTGAGERAFTAGADIHEMTRNADSQSAGEESSNQPDPKRSEYSWHIGSCKKPTIGALNGLVYGGGAVLASSLDIRVGCERTSFRFLAAAYGRVNATWSLPMQVGWPKAKELLFTTRVVESEEALQIGLLNHLVHSDDLMEKAREIGRLIAGNDARMVQGIKRLMIDNVGTPWRDMHANEYIAVSENLAPPPIAEGFSEFLEKK